MSYTEDAKTVPLLLEHCLGALVEVYRQEGVPLPDRRYWTVGQAAWDCEQATVSLLQTYLGVPGQPADGATRCETPRSATIAISIVRPAAIWEENSETPPTPTDIQNAAVPVGVDVWLLYAVAAQCDRYGIGVIATVDVLQPEGGLHGCVATLTVQI